MATKSDVVFKYRIRNWPEHKRALVRRGSVTFNRMATLWPPRSERVLRG